MQKTCPTISALERESTPQDSSKSTLRMHYKPRDIFLLVVISIVVALSGVVGESYILGEGRPKFSLVESLLLFVIGAIVFAAIAIGVDFLYGLCSRQKKSIRDNKRENKRHFLDALTPKMSFRSVAAFSAVMLLVWLPWLIVCFPGATDFDAYYMISEFYPESHPLTVVPTPYYEYETIDAQFVDHHPFFTTLVFGAFAIVSDILTGSWTWGIFVYVLLQGILTSVALNISLAYLSSRGCPRGIVIAGFIFLCVIPFVPNFAFYMTKDSLYGLLFIPYFMMLFEIVRLRGEVNLSTKRVIAFVLLGILLSLTKKTGLYVVVPTAIFAAIVLRKQCKVFITQAIACLVTMMLVLPMIVFPMFNVADGGKQEAIGLLFQQTAAYAKRHPALYLPEEKAAVDAVSDYNTLGRVYDYKLHDAAKWLYKQDSTNEELFEYIKAWAALGLRDPEAYLSAFMGVAGQYLSPSATYQVDLIGLSRHINDWHVIYGAEGDNQDRGRLVYEYPEEMWDFQHGVFKEFWMGISNIPIIGLLFQMVLYMFWVPALALFVILRRQLKAGVLILPIFISLLFCLIGPFYSARYCVAIIYITPLLVGMLAVLVKEKQSCKGAEENLCLSE